MMQHGNDEDITRARKALEAKDLILVGENVHRPFHFVLYMEKGKAKFGQIPAHYCHRYGIDVWATCQDGRLWYQSGEISRKMSNDLVKLIQEFEASPEKFDHLDRLDLNLIQIDW